MTILSYVGNKINKYGRLKTYLVAVSLISAVFSAVVAVWFAITFFDLIGAFKDVHNVIVDLFRTCGYIFRALSLITLFLFFVRDYRKRRSGKFRLALLFLLIQSVFDFSYFIFNSVWNSIEYLSRSDITTGITLRVLVFILFLLSLYGLYRQSKKDFPSAAKKTVLLLLFVLSIGAQILLEQNRIYGGKHTSNLIVAEIAGFFIYSPYIIYMISGKAHYQREAPKKKKSSAAHKSEAKPKTRKQTKPVLRSHPKSTHARREPIMKKTGTSELDDFSKALAKLDRSYKNGEISKRRYEREKEKLIDEL